MTEGGRSYVITPALEPIFSQIYLIKLLTVSLPVFDFQFEYIQLRLK